MKNKILILLSRLPYPPYQGDKLKLFNLIKQLSKMGHDITLISFIASKEELRYIPTLKVYCSEVHTIYFPVWKSFLKCILNVFSSKPFQVAYYSSNNFKHRLKNTLISTHFDIVHIHLIRMAQYMNNDKGGIPRVLDLTDAGSLYLERFLRTKKQFLYKFLLKVELNRLREYENILGSFDYNLVCSEIDKKHLLQNSPKANIELLFNGIDLEYFIDTTRIKPEPYRIIFTGNMSYFPNEDGILYFVKDIFPKIKEQIKEAHLYIVGKDPSKKIRNLAKHYITITGFVPEIRAEYLRSSVAVAPIRFGAGTLNKILEPMALGIPVVATSIGIEGLPVQAGRDVLIADNPPDFANAVVEILKDKSLQHRLSVNAKTIARSLYDWKIITKKLDSYYTELLSQRRKVVHNG